MKATSVPNRHTASSRAATRSKHAPRARCRQADAGFSCAYGTVSRMVAKNISRSSASRQTSLSTSATSKAHRSRGVQSAMPMVMDVSFWTAVRSRLQRAHHTRAHEPSRTHAHPTSDVSECARAMHIKERARARLGAPDQGCFNGCRPATHFTFRTLVPMLQPNVSKDALPALQ